MEEVCQAGAARRVEDEAHELQDQQHVADDWLHAKSGKLSFTRSEGRIDEGAEAEEDATYGPSRRTPSEASDNSDLATAATGAEPGDATSAPVSPPPVAPPPSISPMSGFDLHRDATLL